MKSFFALTAAAASLALVHGANCDLGVVGPLLSDADVVQCKVDTGLSPPVPPAADVLPKLCGNKACLAALAKLKSLGVGDCTVGTIALETDFTKPIEAFCAKAATTPSATPTTTPATTPAPATSPAPTTKAPTITPEPTTKAPLVTTETKTPAPTTATSSDSGSKTAGSDTAIEENSQAGVPLLSSGSDSSLDIETPVTKTPAAKTPAPSVTQSSASSIAFTVSAVVLAVAAAFM